MFFQMNSGSPSWRLQHLIFCLRDHRFLVALVNLQEQCQLLGAKKCSKKELNFYNLEEKQMKINLAVCTNSSQCILKYLSQKSYFQEIAAYQRISGGFCP